MKTLLLTLSLIIISPNLFSQFITIGEDGIVRCKDVTIGTTEVIDGITYEVVDRGLLIQRRDEGADLTKSCVSNVTKMDSLFFGITEFNQQIGNWDVSNVTSMHFMFFGANEFNQPIGEWDVSKVTAMRAMFANTKFNQDLSNWCVSNFTSEPDAFSSNSPLTNENKPVWGTCQGTPEPITLLTPNNVSSDIDIKTPFTWETDSSSTHYQLQVFEGQSITLTDTLVDTTSFVLPFSLKPNTTHYWKVRGINNDKDLTGEWSSIWSFTTGIDSLSNDWDNDGIVNEVDICPTTPRIYSDSSQAIPDITYMEFCTSIKQNVPHLEFMIGVSDNINKNNPIQLLYWLEGNRQTWTSINFEDNNNQYELSAELNKYAANGTYSIRGINVIDNSGNQIRFREDFLSNQGFNTKSILDHPNSDNTPPRVNGLKSSGWIFDENEIPSIEFSLKASDDSSGLMSDKLIELKSPSGNSIMVRSSIDTNSTSIFKFELSKYVSSGTYYIHTIRLYDNAGNSNFSYDWLEENPQNFILENPNSDSLSPALKSFNLTSRFDKFSSRPIMTIKGEVNDDISGVNGILLRLRDPNNFLIDRWLKYYHGNGVLKSIFNEDIALTTLFDPGIYTVDYLKLSDVAENTIDLLQSDIQDLDSTFSVDIGVFFPTNDEVLNGQSDVQGTINDDYIFGNNKTVDLIDGSMGNDIIHSSSNSDILNGGVGADTFIFSSSEHSNVNGFDTIKDYEKSKDIVRIPKFTNSKLQNVDWSNDLNSTIESIIGNDNLSEEVIFFTDGIDGFIYHNRKKEFNLLIKLTGISNPSDITIIQNEVSQVNLSSPKKDTTGISLLTELIWNEDESADNYRLQLSNDDFLTTIIDTVLFDISYKITDTLSINSGYKWRVKSINSVSSSDWSESWSFTTGISTSIEKIFRPTEYKLYQNYPNPFNPTTTIQYSLSENTSVIIAVYDILGQKVMELVNTQQSAGYHTATFDASGLSSGVYLYKLTTPSFTETKKMLLVK